MENKTSVTKLNNNNYQNWKFKAEMVLIRDDSWDIVIGSVPDNPDSAWIKRNNQARASIGLMVEDNQLTHIRQYANACEIWTALRKVHERSNLCGKLFLLRKLYKKRLEAGQSMREHINAMLETVDQLRALGEVMKDSHVAALLLCSLPESYSTLITALEARPEEDLTLEFVKGKLMDEHDRRRENENTQGNSDELALNTTHRDKSRRDVKRCYHCQKIGHIRKNCRLLKRSNDVHKVKAATGPTSGNPTFAFKDNTNDDENYCFGIKEKRGVTEWYVDSGATSHMTNNKSFFTRFEEYQEPVDIYLADGNIAKAYGNGEGMLQCIIAQKINKVKLKNVLYVPCLEGSLLSVKTLSVSNYVVKFEKDVCEIMYAGNIVARARLDPILYKLEVLIINQSMTCVNKNEHNECLHIWHRRMGHRDPTMIEKMYNEKLVTGMKLLKCDKYLKCIGCIKGKTTSKSFPKASNNRATEPFQVMHSDVCGPMHTSTFQGKYYIVTLIDDFSRYTEVCLMEKKSETENRIKEYIQRGKNKFQRTLQIIRSDRGGEYLSASFDKYLRENGIERQLTVPHSPQQNGIAERKNRSLVETARCMLFDAKLGNSFWGEAIVTANYLQNRLIHRSSGVTPYQLWSGKIPDVRHIRVFGCQAFAFIPGKRHKFDSTTQEGILLGYSDQSKGYRILIKGTKRIVISRTVKFIEETSTTTFTDIPTTNDPVIIEPDKFESVSDTIDIDTKELIVDHVIKPDQENETQTDQVIRTSSRINKGIPAQRYGYQVVSQIINEPSSWKEMLKMPTQLRNNWIKAADTEMKAMRDNQAWDLVNLPQNKISIPSRWVFKIKQPLMSEPIFKARLVAKGYLQRPGEDFDSVFAPVVRNVTIRTLLAVAAKIGMISRHLDAKTAFLQGNIDGDVYMDQPVGYIEKGQEHLVCKLKKSIYGLKQSARIWNQRINTVLLDLGFKQGEADNCLYIRGKDKLLTIVLLYVDDILIYANTSASIETILKDLSVVLEIKDMGPASSYLGIHINQTKNGNIEIDQCTKIDHVIDRFNMSEAKDASTPMEANFLKISNENDALLPDDSEYRENIGSLLYIANTTRPDISTAVGILARRVEKPKISDMTALKRVIRYLKKTRNIKIVYNKSPECDLKIYADADWAGDTSDRKSTSGMVFLFGGALIAWGSRKQTCVSLSSTEAEFVSAAHAAQEAIWTGRLLTDLGYPIDKPIPIYEDNQGCIALASSEKVSARTKHMDVRLQFLRDLQNDGTISMIYCPTEEMLADLFTKPLPAPRFYELLNKLGITH